MQKIRSISLFLLVSIWPVVFSTQAISSEVNISGFGTIGVSATDSETPYLREMLTEDPSYVADTIIGLQFSGKLQPGFEYFAQWIAKDSNGHFDSNADWLLISFPVNENLTIRGGRLRLPLFFLSKQVEVGAIYPWIRPPAAIYELIEYTGYTGFDLLYTFPTDKLNIVIQPFVGQTKEELSVDLLPGGPAEISTEENFGLAIQTTKGLAKVKLAYFRASTALTLNKTFTDATGTSPLVPSLAENIAEYFAFGIQLENEDWILISEAAQRKIRPYITPDVASYSIMIGRHISNILVHATFSVRNTEGPDLISAGVQEDETTTLGIKYSPSFDSAFKIEWSYGNPKNNSAGLFRNITKATEDINTVGFVYDWIF